MMKFLMRTFVLFVFAIMLCSLIVGVGKASPLAITEIRIEPTGYEDPSTGEWKGSFWTITATTDTRESFLFYTFNETEANSFSKNKIEDKTVIPEASIKITITPKEPYWERPLVMERWLVYPKTYGTYLNYISKQGWKIQDQYVEALYADVLCSGVDSLWTKHTPFDFTVEKIGNNSFTKTLAIDTVGGTQELVITNPYDDSEKLMVTSLGQLGTGYGQPSITDVLVFKRDSQCVAFEKSEVEKAVKYGRDLQTGGVLEDENYAFYWFGGGSHYLTPSSHEEVRWYFDDKSPAHAVYKSVPIIGEYRSPVEDSDFSGSYRSDGPNFWDKRVLPIAASIWDDNPNTNPPNGMSLVTYLGNKTFGSVDLDAYWRKGWFVTNDNKLRIRMPLGAASSLITIKISTELADSVVSQPIVGGGKFEEAFWSAEGSGSTTCTMQKNNTAILKVKQLSSETSKITVKPSISGNVPVSVTPFMDSAILAPQSVKEFCFEVRSLGSETRQISTIAFQLTNDLGAVTDTRTLEFELLPFENPAAQKAEDGGHSLWIWLVLVSAISAVSIGGFGIYRFRSTRKNRTRTAQTATEAPEKMTAQTTRKPRLRRKLLIASSLIILAIGAGLTVYYYDAYHKLGFGLAGVGIGDIGYTSAELRLTLEIQNPDFLPIYIPNGDFEIYLNNQHLCSGHFGSIMIGGNSKGRVLVPVTFYATDIPFLAYGLITGGGTVTIRIEGSAHVLLFDLPFSTTLYDAKLV
jgi:LEA14-like dessication related protein